MQMDQQTTTKTVKVKFTVKCLALKLNSESSLHNSGKLEKTFPRDGMLFMDIIIC